MSEFEHEPIRGLPERPPEGEQILWQGAPRYRAFARRAFRFRALAFYFGVLAAWCVASLLQDGVSVAAVVKSSLWLILMAAIAVCIFMTLSWLIARTTVYTVTSRRIAIRFGVALPMTVNIPFKAIASADARIDPDGTGDITISIMPGQRIAYLALWPHVRPWRFAKPQPMLRGVGSAGKAAQILANALAAEAESSVRGMAPVPGTKPRSSPAPLEPVAA